MPTARRTPRDLAREETMRRILEAGRRELAANGADGLSLRAVAREVGLVSSAIYRYVASRDELLTALIVDGYESLGAAVQSAVNGRAAPGRRWVRGCESLRRWALDQPQVYTLLFGSPVPGYSAPQTTIAAATLAPTAAASTVADAYTAGTLTVPAAATGRRLRHQSDLAAQAFEIEVPAAVALRFAQAWTQVLGVVSLELFGHLVGTFDPADEFATATFRCAAEHIGFTDL